MDPGLDLKIERFFSKFHQIFSWIHLFSRKKVDRGTRAKSGANFLIHLFPRKKVDPGLDLKIERFFSKFHQIFWTRAKSGANFLIHLFPRKKVDPGLDLKIENKILTNFHHMFSWIHLFWRKKVDPGLKIERFFEISSNILLDPPFFEEKGGSRDPGQKWSQFPDPPFCEEKGGSGLKPLRQFFKI